MLATVLYWTVRNVLKYCFNWSRHYHLVCHYFMNCACRGRRARVILPDLSASQMTTLTATTIGSITTNFTILTTWLSLLSESLTYIRTGIHSYSQCLVQTAQLCLQFHVCVCVHMSLWIIHLQFQSTIWSFLAMAQIFSILLSKVAYLVMKALFSSHGSSTRPLSLLTLLSWTL